MQTAYDENRASFRIGDEFARGGQGVILNLHGVDTHCIKLYHRPPAPQQVAKLRLLRERAEALVGFAALPCSIAFADPTLQSPLGLFLPFIKGHGIFDLYGTSSRIEHFPKATFQFLVHAAYNLAVAFEAIHINGMVIGDVNEQNVRVMPDATVRLIDCDSFQVADGNRLFTSDVGTPIWTPPELQGCNLTSLPRTTNHDMFGLAQLIFLLLFVGRYPFSGVPRSNRHLLVEDAIREYAFAFAPVELGLPLSPPPGSPPTQALPKPIRDGFTRAFLRGSAQPGARPTAKEWKALLLDLMNELVACGRHPSHVFWKGASSCPWCIIARDTSVEVFPGLDLPIGGIRTGAPDDYIRTLSKLTPYPFVVYTPSVLSQASPEPPRASKNALSFICRLLGRNVVKRWNLKMALRRNQRILTGAEAGLTANAARQREAITKYIESFRRLSPKIKQLVATLTHPASERDLIEMSARRERQRFELIAFLKRASLRTAWVGGIGPSRKATLQSYGIETAADVTYQSITKIPGFGPTLADQLVGWRNECESKFRFDPSKPLPPELERDLERRLREKITQVKGELARVESELSSAQQQCGKFIYESRSHADYNGRLRDRAKAAMKCLALEIRHL